MVKTILEIITGCFVGLVIIWFLGVDSKQKPIEQICIENGIHCQVVYLKNGVPNAFVQEDKPVIYVTGDLQNKISKDELQSVLLHELGHLVLQHDKRFKEENEFHKSTFGYEMSPAQACSLHRQMEYEADRFSVLTAIKYGYPVLLDNFFENHLKNTKGYYLETCSHPAVYKRVEKIRELERIYLPK